MITKRFHNCIKIIVLHVNVVGILLTRGKHVHDRIISLCVKFMSNKLVEGVYNSMAKKDKKTSKSLLIKDIKPIQYRSVKRDRVNAKLSHRYVLAISGQQTKLYQPLCK